MNEILIFVITIVISIGFTFGVNENVTSLCDNPWIDAADYLPNNTVRVYRGNHYWELNGLPDTVATTVGPYKITQQYMAPVEEATSIVTIPSGPLAGYGYKFYGKAMWQYNQNSESLQSKHVNGGKDGRAWSGSDQGFRCAMSEGEVEKGYTTIIALVANRVYYWKINTTTKLLEPLGDIIGYNQTGQFNENYPRGIDACTTFKDNKTGKYYVYLFRGNMYCFRPNNGVIGCPEWRFNKDLFGCNGGKKTPSSMTSGGCVAPITQKNLAVSPA